MKKVKIVILATGSRVDTYEATAERLISMRRAVRESEYEAYIEQRKKKVVEPEYHKSQPPPKVQPPYLQDMLKPATPLPATAEPQHKTKRGRPRK